MRLSSWICTPRRLIGLVVLAAVVGFVAWSVHTEADWFVRVYSSLDPWGCRWAGLRTKTYTSFSIGDDGRIVLGKELGTDATGARCVANREKDTKCYASGTIVTINEYDPDGERVAFCYESLIDQWPHKPVKTSVGPHGEHLIEQSNPGSCVYRVKDVSVRVGHTSKWIVADREGQWIGWTDTDYTHGIGASINLVWKVYLASDGAIEAVGFNTCYLDWHRDPDYWGCQSETKYSAEGQLTDSRYRDIPDDQLGSTPRVVAVPDWHTWLRTEPATARRIAQLVKPNTPVWDAAVACR
jgi:hypothetical protein